MTAATVMPAATVPAPPRTPVPFGLFSTFTFRPAGARWSAGVRFDTAGCLEPLKGIGPGGYCEDPAAVVGLADRLADDITPGGEGEALPFTVQAEHKCSPVAGDHRRLAEERLAAGEERAAERAFWTGQLGNFPSLRDATELTTGAVPPAVGVGLLEEWLATVYGSQGVIHMPRLVASVAEVRPAGQLLRTALGTPVAAGAGYDGSSPDGAAASGTARWVYATPALSGYRSDVDITELFDPGSNDLSVYAARDYLLMFEDCGTAAVLVDAGGSTGGGSNVAVDPNNSDLLILQ